MQMKLFPTLTAISILCIMSNASPSANAQGEQAWLNEASKDAFKPQPVSGSLDGLSVKLVSTTMENMSGGYMFRFRQKEGDNFPGVDLWLKLKEDPANKTYVLPLQKSTGDESSLMFHTGHLSSLAPDGFAGKIQFGKWDKGLLAGYCSIRIAREKVKNSAINGYFYAKKL